MFTEYQIILLIQEHCVKHLIFYHFQVSSCVLIPYMGIKYLIILSLILWVICSQVLIADIHGKIFLNLIHIKTSKINTTIAKSFKDLPVFSVNFKNVLFQTRTFQISNLTYIVLFFFSEYFFGPKRKTFCPKWFGLPNKVLKKFCKISMT